MFRNIYFDRRKCIIHIWETFKGEKMYDTVDWVPSVFIATSEKNSTHKSIEGTPVVRKDFTNIKEYKDFIESTKKKPGILFEDIVKPEIQYLVDKTYAIDDDKIEVPELLVYSIDIEVHKDQGFTDPIRAEDPIVLISVRDCNHQKTYTWGFKPYNKKTEHDDIYFQCQNEDELLRKFLKWWHTNPCDVATGWNCLEGNQSVWLKDRITKIKDAKVQDFITDHRYTGKKKEYCIKTCSGHKIYSSLDHKFFVVSKDSFKYKNGNTLISNLEEKKVYQMIESTKDQYLILKKNNNENKNLTIKDMLLNSFHKINFVITSTSIRDKIKNLNIKARKEYFYGETFWKRSPRFWSYNNLKEFLSEEEIVDYINENKSIPIIFGKKKVVILNLLETIDNDYLYLLGMIFTDGFYSHYDNDFVITNGNFSILNAVRNKVENLKITSYEKIDKRWNGCNIHISKHNVLGLLYHMIYHNDNKTLDKTLLSLLSKEQFYKFLSGIIDGDGCISNGIEIANVDEDTRLILSELLLWNGIYSNVIIGKVYIAMNNYTSFLKEKLILFHNEKDVKLKNFDIYEKKNSRSKNIKFYEYDDKVAVKILEIMETGIEVDMYDITTIDHKFISSCGILTHNCYGFDFPYIIRRIHNTIGKGKEAMLSPIGEVQMWMAKDESSTNIDIAGISIIDYLPLYKRLGDNLESYSLEVVSNHVLEKGKLNYGQEAASLSDLYYNNWEMYVDYNKIDAKRVAQIEEKCKFIQLTQILSLITRCPMKYTDAQTSLIEGAMLTWLRRNGMCAPQFKGGHKEDFPGGFVKEPKIGKYEWVFSVDIQSSYPSHIITLNMSSETLMGRIAGFTEEEVMEHTLTREFPEFTMIKDGKRLIFDEHKLKRFNQGLKEKQFSVAPNGSVFMTNKKGTLARFQRDYFNKRLEYKGKMKTDKANKPYWNSLQNSIKTILNAFYGATSVPYSRYHNLDISTAITSCGRRSVQKAMEYTTERFGDIVLYGDTDSLYCHFEPVILKKMKSEIWKDIDREKKVEIIKLFLNQYENLINGDIFEKVQKGYYNSNVEDFQIRFVPERICDTALFIMKKKYALYHDGKVKVKGLEIVRSDTPSAIKEKLKEIMDMILKGAPDEEISDKINSHRTELESVAPEEIASNIGVNNVDKYTNDDGNHTKGSPMAVKAVIYTNKLIERFKIDHPPLEQGLKTKVAYVKKNKYEYDTIAFYRWKQDFNKIGISIDYNEMIKKYYDNKIETLLEPMNKVNLLKHTDIDSFFS